MSDAEKDTWTARCKAFYGVHDPHISDDMAGQIATLYFGKEDALNEKVRRRPWHRPPPRPRPTHSSSHPALCPQLLPPLTEKLRDMYKADLNSPPPSAKDKKRLALEKSKAARAFSVKQKALQAKAKGGDTPGAKAAVLPPCFAAFVVACFTCREGGDDDGAKESAEREARAAGMGEVEARETAAAASQDGTCPLRSRALALPCPYVRC